MEIAIIYFGITHRPVYHLQEPSLTHPKTSNAGLPSTTKTIIIVGPLEIQYGASYSELTEIAVSTNWGILFVSVLIIAPLIASPEY